MDIHEKLWSSLWETITHFPDCTVRLFCETSPCDACPVCLTYLSFHFYHLHITSKLLHFPAEALAYISFQENAFPPNIYSYIEQFTFHCCSQACQHFQSISAFSAEGKVWVSSVLLFFKALHCEIKPTLKRLPFQKTFEAQ